ncbi:unnamed protein product [Paramecium sonneborni]|uniref:Uncharacterized protein n=1 Tax=Paramecium sonneborni TaxID=65129 RepID=A0A8S1Q587_9CILI|nr:unnamed protein product [Paramecium sonneborni]
MHIKQEILTINLHSNNKLYLFQDLDRTLIKLYILILIKGYNLYEEITVNQQDRQIEQIYLIQDFNYCIIQHLQLFLMTSNNFTDKILNPFYYHNNQQQVFHLMVKDRKNMLHYQLEPFHLKIYCQLLLNLLYKHLLQFAYSCL